MEPDINIPTPNTLLTRRDLIAAMRQQAFNFSRYKMLAHEARVQGNGVIADLFEQTADEECLEHFADLGELLQMADDDGPSLQAGSGFIEADAVHALSSQQAQGNGGWPIIAQSADQPEHQRPLAFQDALIRLQIMNWLAGPEQARRSR